MLLILSNLPVLLEPHGAKKYVKMSMPIRLIYSRREHLVSVLADIYRPIGERHFDGLRDGDIGNDVDRPMVVAVHMHHIEH